MVWSATEAPQRDHPLREVFNGLRYIARSGVAWRMMPNDLPPWYTVYQQTQRWLKAGVFEAMVHDLRALQRTAQGRQPNPSAAIFDGRTLQSSPESGQRAGCDGAKRKRGSKTHMGVDTLEQERAQVEQLAQEVQAVTGESVELAFVDQGYTGEQAAQDAARQGMRLEVIKLPEAKQGFVLSLPWHGRHLTKSLSNLLPLLGRLNGRLPTGLNGHTAVSGARNRDGRGTQIVNVQNIWPNRPRARNSEN